jgi:hypothetical protein
LIERTGGLASLYRRTARHRGLVRKASGLIPSYFDSTIKLLKASPEEYPIYDYLFQALESLKVSPSAWSAALAVKGKDKELETEPGLKLFSMAVFFDAFV